MRFRSTSIPILPGKWRFALVLLLLVGLSVRGAQSGSLPFFGGWWRTPHLAVVSGRVLLLTGKLTQAGRLVQKSALPLPIQQGNVLDVGAKSQAEVACANGKVLRWKQGRHTVDCESQTPAETGELEGWNRGRKAAVGPLHIVWPRRTALLNARPWLRWTPVEGAGPYRVTLWLEAEPNGEGKAGKVLWSRTVATSTQLLYPSDAEPLQVGHQYRFVVERDGWSTDDSDEAADGFTLLNAQGATTVRAAETQLNKAGFEKPVQEWMRAALYEANSLNAESLQMLETLPPTLARWRLMGDLYFKTRLASEAETTYRRALAAAEATNENQDAAYFNLQLGRLLAATSRDDTSQARRFLESARDFARQSGDAQSLARIEAELKTLP